ncbi:galactokinase [Candidatus Latescibacterota bacterium]
MKKSIKYYNPVEMRDMIESSLIQEFETRFGVSPTHIVAAPGRVNLIGEHTDYNGFPVLPISIANSIKAVVSPRSDKKICIQNLSSQYESVSFDIKHDIPHSSRGHWSSYAKAAISALAGYRGFCGDMFSGMNALYEGDIPISAGLSSSSALVIASALSLLAVNGLEMGSIELAELMAEGEWYVGTQGGGMDQAICLLGKRGYTVKIDFFPLKYQYIPFPENYSIIVAHSLIRASKTKNTLFQYNKRVSECRLATALINSVYKPDKSITLLGDLPGTKFYDSFDNPGDFIHNTFDREVYSLNELSLITNVPETVLTEKYLFGRDGKSIPFDDSGFFLRKRALHVLTEAERVERSCEALRQSDAAGFGALMNLSHQSCNKNYEISTPELNTLVSIMSESGALGARLTGAGFGGCAVALVRDDMIQNSMDKIRELYYNTYLGKKHPELVENSEIRNDIFVVKPSNGAQVTAL